MNQLGITLVTVAVQVTLAVIPAVIIVAMIGRRSPRAAATLSIVALVLCLGLTATAFAPSPPWREWLGTAGTRTTPVTEAASAQPDATETAFIGWGVPFRRFMKFLSVNGPLEDEQQAWSGWAWLALVVLAAATLAALRLTVGLWAVAACRARSRPIRDAGMQQLVDELRHEVGCRPLVEVRASAAVGTAATIGWRRPAVLLADDWPAWAPDELRAVLAHELAHVRHKDYSAALFASLCRALHFYHPLIAWLTRRLRLHQELAADGIAAEAVGGRAAYLVALARMALREERFCVAGEARPFLSDRNSLLRRIAMLRVTDDGRTLSKGARAGLAAVLIGAALAASAVRGTAQAPAKIEAASAELPPIDLCYVPEKSDGVFVVRPAALLARPEMKPVLENWNRTVAESLRAVGITLPIDLAEIELVLGPFELKIFTDEEVRKNGNPERHAIVTSVATIRMTRDYDWPAVFKSLAPVVQLTELKPGTFECRCPAFAPHPLTVHTPDRRTLFLGLAPGQALPQKIDNSARWGQAGKRVERAGFAIVMDNRTGRWTDALSKDNAVPAELVAALGRPAHMAYGLNWGERLAASCAADWDEEPTEDGVARMTATIRKLIETERKNDPPEDKATRLMLDVADEMMKSGSVGREGKVVTAEGSSNVRWVDVLKAFPLDGTAKTEGKSIEK
jgi:beta-lactamase regulating signal transducer with metallopeptidase domain